MRKLSLLIIIFLILTIIPISAFAAEGDCICGRRYSTDATDEQDLYVCPGCGRNFLLCTCDCFCGNTAETTTDEEGNTIKICSGCERPAVECTCVDRETALSLENAIENGTVSTSGLTIPQNPAGIIITTLLIIGAVIFWLMGKKLLSSKKNAAEKENEDKNETEKELGRPSEPSGFEIYRLLHTLYEETSSSFPDAFFPEEADAVHLTEQDVDLFKKALIGEETDISYFLNMISQKLLDSSLFPTEKGLHCAKILYEKVEDYRVGYGIYETARIFKDNDRFDVRLEQGDKISLYLSMSAAEVASLLRRCINHRPKRDFELDKTNVCLNKEEWILFVYILYTGLKTFSKELLRAKETSINFAKRTKTPTGKDFKKKAERIIKDSEKFDTVFESLYQKGIISLTDLGDFEIKENVFKDFDPSKFMNVVYFEELENGREIIHLNFILNNKGGVAVFEKDDDIKLVSSFTIPWSHYIR